NSTQRWHSGAFTVRGCAPSTAPNLRNRWGAVLRSVRLCRDQLESTSGGRALRRVHVLRQSLLGLLHEGVERRGVVDGQLGEHPAVDLHPGGAQTLHEPVVGHPPGAGRSVDPRDPQPAEVTRAGRAVTVGVGARVRHLLLGLAVQPGALAAVTAGALEGRPALLMGVDRPLDACHVLLLVVGGRRYLPSSFLIFFWSAGATTTSFARRAA